MLNDLIVFEILHYRDIWDICNSYICIFGLICASFIPTVDFMASFWPKIMIQGMLSQENRKLCLNIYYFNYCLVSWNVCKF